MKWEVGFNECLEYVKRAPSRLFLRFHLGMHRMFEELGRHAKGSGSQECPNCGACKELVEYVLSKRASYDSQKIIFWTI